jgi:hypothetical protein
VPLYLPDGRRRTLELALARAAAGDFRAVRRAAATPAVGAHALAAAVAAAVAAGRDPAATLRPHWSPRPAGRPPAFAPKGPARPAGAGGGAFQLQTDAGAAPARMLHPLRARLAAAAASSAAAADRGGGRRRGLAG